MSRRLAWATDVHFNFLGEPQIEAFCRDVERIGADGLILSGDIGEAPTIERYLTKLEAELKTSIFFVLGNHDFYRGSIKRVRRRVGDLCERSEHLHYLPQTGVVELTSEVALLGCDGWADGRLGDYATSTVLLNDYSIIDELSGLTKSRRLIQLNLLGDEAAAFARQHLPAALERFRKVYFVTHVPPFEEASWHEGGLSDDQWLPHFACKALGDALVECVEGREGCEVTVLCGHTHGRGVARILPNLVVRTGAAVYGRPAVEEVIDLD